MGELAVRRAGWQAHESSFGPKHLATRVKQRPGHVGYFLFGAFRKTAFLDCFILPSPNRRYQCPKKLKNARRTADLLRRAR